MLAYYFKLGLRSLRRAPVLTALMVVILAVGIAASMTSLTMLLALSGDPIPGKSDRLFTPRLDTRPLEGADDLSTPDLQMTYTDATNLLRAGFGARRTVLYGIAPAVDGGSRSPAAAREPGIATTADLFVMLDVPFREGAGWTPEDDARGADVAVIGSALALRLFGDDAAVGQRLRVDEREYTVTGVIGDWAPTPKFYRVYGSSATGAPEQLWIPFSNALSRFYRNEGWTSCDGAEPGYDFQAFLDSDCTWIQYWVELASAADARGLRDHVSAYVAQQKALGRMPRPDNSRVLGVRDLLDDIGVVGNDTRLATWVAFGFLCVCLVNLMALMLAKFTARQGEIGVRRALGARRRDIFAQYLVEAGVVGAAGAIAGAALALYGVSLLGEGLADSPGFYRMDPRLLAATVGLSVVCALVAGLLPTWRAACVRPAIQLKSQ
jgi:putative ABC transport system permease protein